MARAPDDRAGILPDRGSLAARSLGAGPGTGTVGEPDPLLWFEAPCGGRDLLTGNGGTYPGRMAAWCPAKKVSYNVSLAEMGQMSQQARYYVAGFLAGNQPGPPPPPDPDADIDPGDLTAWKAAAGRFRRTGLWLGRWRTCHTCGRVLVPDNRRRQLPGTPPGEVFIAGCSARPD